MLVNDIVILQLTILYFSDGCRPYVEIYNEDRLVLSTLQDYDRLHLYTAAEGKVRYLIIYDFVLRLCNNMP